VEAEKRIVGRSHVIVLGLIVAAIVIWLLFARPRLLCQGQSSEGQSIEQLSSERTSGK
jgi:hypothetical protein